MAADELTRRGRVVLEQIPQIMREQGYSPSVRDIGQALGLSPTGVWHHLKRLSAAGLVTWTPGLSRTIRLTDEGERTVGGCSAERALDDGPVRGRRGGRE